MGTIIAFQGGSDSPSIIDNQVLDQFTIPVGSWGDQMVDWIDVHMEDKIGFDLLGAIKWPFEFLFRTFVKSGDHHPWWEVTDMPWWAVCLIVFVVGSLYRNVKVGIFSAGALGLCGLLAIEIWDDISVTLGMILVSVFLCAIIGIPLGVLAGRIDGVWSVIRPVLDAMQVVHSFVYMLPIVFFFSIGFESATMVTMIFAIPPLIRLTNLGIRQVPEDVVEASRAYGAPEWRVLADVQLPLARPAIMTGLNQTLLLAISMLGMAAIMGAGGIGQLIFRAIQNLDVALGVSGGLALFIVAVVLDRISQTQDSDGTNFLTRIRLAWAARSNPELLLPESDASDPVSEIDATGTLTRLTRRERLGAIVSAGGAVISLVALFLAWGHDAGAISSWPRRLDESLLGNSFNGLVAEGGSWYGLLILGFLTTILLSVAVSLTRPGRGGRWLGPDGTTFCSFAIVALAVGFLVVNQPTTVSEYNRGVGSWVALVGGVIASIGALIWLFDAQYTARIPLPNKTNIVRVVIAAGCVLWAVLAGFSAWAFDQRADEIVTPEIQAQLDDVLARIASGELPQAEGGAEISRIASTAKKDRVVHDGYSADGPGLALVGVVISALGLLASIPAAGFLGLDEWRRWRWSVVTAGLGIGMMAFSGAWITSLLRATDPNFVSGAGSFLLFTSGFILAATSRSTMAEFARTRVFVTDSATMEPTSAESIAQGAPVTV